jgi:SAM-dependent methyltransferase
MAAVSEGHDPQSYGAQIGAEYDALYADIGDTGEAVDRLAALAGDGPVLELGIGTGRLALPLAARGLEVHGVEASAEMVARLREKPGSEAIGVAVGDFAETRSLGAPFALIFLAFNTIFALPSAAAQRRCFRAVAAQLRPGGRFALEAFVLDPAEFEGGMRVAVRTLAPGRRELERTRFDPEEGRLRRTFVNVLDGERVVHTANDTYAAPAELDEMARAAGLRLDSRSADWAGSRFGERSNRHVSVYRLGESAG